MGRKILSVLLIVAMVLAAVPTVMARDTADEAAAVSFRLAPYAPDGRTVEADLLLKADAEEQINGFQITFNGSAKLTSAAIEGARTTAASIGGDTIYWFTTNESDYFTVGTEYMKLATLTFTSDTAITDAWKEISVEDGSSTLTRDLFPAVAVVGKANNQHVPVQIGSNHIHAADGGAGELVYRPLKAGQYAMLPASGNYYLEGDITVTGNTEVPGTKTLNLCLNGHKITYQQEASSVAGRVFSVYGCLNICSCTKQGYATAVYTSEAGPASGGAFASAKATGSHPVEINVANIRFDGFKTADAGGVLRGYAGASKDRNARLNVTNCEFTNNYAELGGAAIYVQAFDELVVTGSRFTKNENKTNRNGAGGGTIWIDGGALLQMTDSDFTENHSVGHGGAVYAKNWMDGSFIKGGVFRKNHAESTSSVRNRAGGAVCLFKGASTDAVFYMEDVLFAENTATAGGAVSNGTSSADCVGSLVIKNCTFQDNTAGSAANAVRAFSKQPTTLDHCSVSRMTDNRFADVQARMGTLYIKNGNDIGDLLVSSGNTPAVEITLAADEYKGDLTIESGLQVTIHQNGFFGELTGTLVNKGTIIWDPTHVEVVQSRICSIGTVTLEKEAAIRSARTAYEKLSEPEKTEVANYRTLEDAEMALAQLKSDQNDAKIVEGLIDAIGTVTPGSGAAIQTARAAYDVLTQAQKELVRNYDVLVTAEQAYRMLSQNAAGFFAAMLPALRKTGSFCDVTKGDWFYEAVQYVYGKRLMDGTGGEKFSPASNTTRGMLVTILARMEDIDTAADTIWYEVGRQWAMRSGISDGSDMLKPITREQLATMLYRYAARNGYDTASRADIRRFTDAADCSNWAEEAIEWAVGVGLLEGSGDRLTPQAPATRAQVAMILMRCLKTLA